MPAQPAWFHRLDEILGALRSMTSTHLDRAAVEKLFRVRQRRARQIMAGLGSPLSGGRLHFLGGGFAITKGTYKRYLTRPSAGGRHGDLDLAALVYLKTVHQLDWSD